MGGSVCPVGRNKPSSGAKGMTFAKGLPDEREFLIRLDAPKLPDFSKVKCSVAGQGLEVAEVARVEQRTVNIITPGAVIVVSRHMAIGRHAVV